MGVVAAPLDLDVLLAEAADVARRQFAELAEVPAVIYGHTPNGPMHVFPFQPETGPGAWADMVRLVMRARGVVAYTFIGEGWASETAAAAPAGTMRPSQAPDAVEMVCCIAANASRCIGHHYRILRPLDGPRRMADKPEDFRPEQGFGWLLDLLRDDSQAVH